MDRAISYIDENAPTLQNIGQISAALGANDRTLRRAFRDRFGVAPKTYLTAVRLDGVRRDFRRSTPEISVVDVANRWGFWHMGEFAKDYRQVFGELPSVTLRARVTPSGSSAGFAD